MAIQTKVSVCMITYNHEKFIREAIEGVLMQQCNFEVELIVANDCSTDASDEVIQDILKNHPQSSWIKYTKHDKNLGMMPNFVYAMQQCQGEYIALCEGDDYWIDPLKLQKQVAFLDGNLDSNICFHRANLLLKGEFVLHEIPTSIDLENCQYKDLLTTYNFITTASVLFRIEEKIIFPKWFYKITYGDLGLYKLINKDKRIMCLTDVMSVYRSHEEGIYSKMSKQEQNIQILNFFKDIRCLATEEEIEILKNKRKAIINELAICKYPNFRILNYFFKSYLYIKY